MHVRHTTKEDLSGIERVEFDRYETLYKEQPKKKKHFRKMLEKRLRIANEWMWVVIDNDRVTGSLSAQPTTKSLKDFESWEKSTNYGSLEGTFENHGKNVYVVNLDVLREGTKKGAQYLLMTHLAAKVIAENKNIVFFESRMPQFREWVRDDLRLSENQWSVLSSKDKLEKAIKYSKLKVSNGGTSIPKDRLLRFYLRAGFKQDRVVADAFDDPESLNFGVVFFANNPLPFILRIPGVRHVLAGFVKLFSKNPKILDWLV